MRFCCGSDVQCCASVGKHGNSGSQSIVPFWIPSIWNTCARCAHVCDGKPLDADFVCLSAWWTSGMSSYSANEHKLTSILPRQCVYMKWTTRADLSYWWRTGKVNVETFACWHLLLMRVYIPSSAMIYNSSLERHIKTRTMELTWRSKHIQTFLQNFYNILHILPKTYFFLEFFIQHL